LPKPHYYIHSVAELANASENFREIAAIVVQVAEIRLTNYSMTNFEMMDLLAIAVAKDLMNIA
jgi:hypothetical protein